MGPYGIRINAIAPGPFPTEGAWARLSPEGALEDSGSMSTIPMGRVGEMSELQNFASPASTGVFCRVISEPYDNNPPSIRSIKFGQPALTFKSFPASKKAFQRGIQYSVPSTYISNPP